MKKLMEQIQTNRFLGSFLSFYMGAEIDLTSIAVAYYLLLSVFPILMLLANLLPYLDWDMAQLLDMLKNIFPAELYPKVAEVVTTILTRPSSSLLGISIVTTLWTFSRSITALQKAVNKAYGVEQHRDMIVGHVVSVTLSVVLQILLTLSVVLGTFGKGVLTFFHQQLGMSRDLYQQLLELSQPLVYLSLFWGLIILYFFLPNVKISTLRYVLPGAVFVTTTLGLVGHLFALYVQSYADRWLSIRLLTSVMILVLMLWFIFLSKLLIVGAVLNATYQSLHVDDFTPRRGTVAAVLHKLKELMRKSQ